MLYYSTLILRGGADQFLEESHRSVWDALNVVKRCIQNTEIVAGGGAIEMEVSKALIAANFAAQLAQPKTHTPSERKEIAGKVNAAMLDVFSALQSYVLLRDLKETIDMAMEELKGRACTQVEGKDYPVFKAVVNTMQMPRRYDYSADETWVDLDTKKKAREALLKTLKEPMKVLDEATGVLTTATPATVTSDGGETLKISCPKG